MMISNKMQKRMGWTVSILLALMFTMSAMMKLTGNEEATKQAATMNINATTYFMLGVMEVLAIVLFLIPRTGVIGALILMVYMGGAVCAHVVSMQPVIPVVLFEVLIWVAAALRFPELTIRLFGNAK
jgi:hypothetical protein